MEAFKFYHLLTLFLSVAVVVSSQEAPSPEDYWKLMLPNTAMPNALKQLLPQPYDLDLQGKANVYAYPGGLGVHAGPLGSGTNVHVGLDGIGVSTGGPFRHRSVNVSPDPRKGITFTNPRGGGVMVHAGTNPFSYSVAVDEKDLHDNPVTTLFFLEKNLRPGKKLNVQFVDSDAQSPFIPREVADSIPFSSDSLPEIYNMLSVDPNSAEAAGIENTVKSCELSRTSGNETLCATSLESMVDYAISKLASDYIQVLSTDTKNPGAMKEYRIVAAKKMASDEGAVFCHRQHYAYAMYYCHNEGPTAVYKILMEALDGSKVYATASCHQDTSKWNPHSMALEVLKVKAGEGSVCHFLPMGDVAWVSSKH